jgi:hypothetical protein
MGKLQVDQKLNEVHVVHNKDERFNFRITQMYGSGDERAVDIQVDGTLEQHIKGLESPRLYRVAEGVAIRIDTAGHTETTTSLFYIVAKRYNVDWLKRL